MKVLSSAINTSGQKREHSNNFMKSVQGAIESVQSLMPSVEDLFNGFFMKSWETKVGNLGASECSTSTNQIEEKGGDDDNLLTEMVLETQSVEDAKNKKEKGNGKKKKKSKKIKGKKK